jgi:hypothetical protein
VQRADRLRIPSFDAGALSTPARIQRGATPAARWATPRASITAALLAAAGCADVLEIPDDPELAPGAWSCLAETSALPLLPVATLPSSARVLVQACDFVRGCETKVTGLTARLCQKHSGACADPVLLDLVDEDGLFTFDVPTPPGGFDGYLDVSSASELCTNPAFGEDGPTLCALAPGCNPALPDARCRTPLYAHALLFFNPPITNDTREPLILRLIPSAALPAWARAAGVALDPGQGNLLVSAVDCDGEPAAGVTYQLDPAPEHAAELYVRDAEPSTVPATDSGDIRAFLGVPEGYTQVSAYNAAHLQIGAIALQSAPFSVTYGALSPVDPEDASAGASP